MKRKTDRIIDEADLIRKERKEKGMLRHTIPIGNIRKKIMPYSEVCMHMQIAGKYMTVELLENDMVQLWDEHGKFSSPIIANEAGIFKSTNGEYYYYE